MSARRVVLIVVAILLALDIAASPRGTVAEAKALVSKALAHYKEVGRRKALADFNSGKAPWRDRDLYVVCIASDLTTVANGAFPQFVGTKANLLKDANGKPLGETIYKVLSSGKGSVHYFWINPMTGKTEPKTIFGDKAGTDVCGVGAYSPE